MTVSSSSENTVASIGKNAKYSIADKHKQHWQLLVLSAKSQTALEQATDNLLTHFKNTPDINLADAAFTLQVGRTRFQYRRMLVCENLNEAISILQTRDAEKIYTVSRKAKNPGIVFLLPGHWAQAAEVTRQLYPIEPVFRTAFEQCAESLKKEHDIDLHDLLHSPPQDADSVGAKVLLFAAEYALARLLMNWIGKTEALLGQGVGAYVADCAAGDIPLDKALAMTMASFIETKIRHAEKLQGRHDVVLELGAGHYLGELAEPLADKQVLATLPAHSELQAAWRSLLITLGKLYCAGIDVD